MKWLAGDVVVCRDDYGMDGRLTTDKYYKVARNVVTWYVQVIDDTGEVLGYPVARFARVTMPTDVGSDEYDTIMKSMEIVDAGRE